MDDFKHENFFHGYTVSVVLVPPGQRVLLVSIDANIDGGFA